MTKATNLPLSQIVCILFREFVASSLWSSEIQLKTDLVMMHETKQTTQTYAERFFATHWMRKQKQTIELMATSGVGQRKINDLMEVWRQWAGRRGIWEAGVEGQDESRHDDQWIVTQHISAWQVIKVDQRNRKKEAGFSKFTYSPVGEENGLRGISNVVHLVVDKDASPNVDCVTSPLLMIHCYVHCYLTYFLGLLPTLYGTSVMCSCARTSGGCADCCKASMGFL